MLGQRPDRVEQATLKTVQGTHGLLSTSEWTGVPSPPSPAKSAFTKMAPGCSRRVPNAAVMTRSIPLQKMLKDAILAYGQNGEAIRPEQGYPLRLILPGYEGNMHIKWLRRLEVGDQPFHDARGDVEVHRSAREWEGAPVHFRNGGQVRHHFPVRREMKLPGAGFYSITGLAWSGRGRVQSVDVSTDRRQDLVSGAFGIVPEPICTIRFSFPWAWGRLRRPCCRAGAPTRPVISSRHWHS